MSVLNANKTIDKQNLDCSETATVTISFDAKSELIARPTDIILIMDESGSMTGGNLTAAKKSAIELINIVTKASGGIDTIENNSRIGIVGFNNTASPLLNLTNDTNALINSINSLTTSGSTNHEDAFIKASDMIDRQSTNEKIVIMFTDGVSTIGGDANAQATLLKQEGIEIYGILLGNNRTQIDNWVTAPIDNHVVATPYASKLEELFKQIAYEVIKIGAQDVLLTEKLNKDFKIVRILNVAPGSVEVKDQQTIEWKISEIGITNQEQAKLEFEVKYLGTENKTIDVNESLTYKDKLNTTLIFPNPKINVTCNSIVIVPDSCNDATIMTIEGCKDSQTVIVKDAFVQDLGRIVQVDVPIKNVCPNKRVALGVILTEVDSDGIEHNRGMKTILINPIVSEKCEDIIVKCINFVVPEAVDMNGSANSLCNTRNFKVRILVNYIDTDFVCCDSETVIVK